MCCCFAGWICRRGHICFCLCPCLPLFCILYKSCDECTFQFIHCGIRKWIIHTPSQKPNPPTVLGPRFVVIVHPGGAGIEADSSRMNKNTKVPNTSNRYGSSTRTRCYLLTSRPTNLRLSISEYNLVQVLVLLVADCLNGNLCVSAGVCN